MNAVLAVFAKLGVDQTIFYQFLIVVILYVVLKTLFLGKLKEILELREARTVKLDTEANHKIHKSQELAATYKQKMDKAYEDAQEVFRARKTDLTTKEKEKLQAFEFHIQTEFENKKKQFLEELSVKKEKVFGTSDQLSQSLVNKLIQ